VPLHHGQRHAVDPPQVGPDFASQVGVKNRAPTWPSALPEEADLLFRNAQKLSGKDREQALDFIEFLVNRKSGE